MNWVVQLRGLYWRETCRFMKVPYQTIGTTIIMSALYFMIFGVSIGKSIHMSNDLPYLAFLIPGMIALSLIRNAFENAISTIIAAKYVNELQDLRVTPLGKTHIVLALSLASLTRGVIVAFLTYCVGTVFYLTLFGVFLPIEHPILLLSFLIFGGMGFGALGLAISMNASNFEQVNSFSSFILVPLIYLGGVFFDLDTLSPFWHYVSELNPLFYLINGIRYCFIGTSDVDIGFSLAVLAIFFIGFFAAALLSLRKGTHYLR